MSEIVVPDGITPDVGWRSWKVMDSQLFSMHQWLEWPPMVVAEAMCSHPPQLRYVPKRYGRVVPVGRTVERAVGQQGAETVGWGYIYETSGLRLPDMPAPTVQLPQGFGYELEELPKDIPEEHCSCGIYALRSKAHFVSSGYLSTDEAFGMVSLWGKIIPAKDGYRARYAYPLKIWTDKKLDDYGVPVEAVGEFDRSVSVRRQLGR